MILISSLASCAITTTTRRDAVALNTTLAVAGGILCVAAGAQFEAYDHSEADPASLLAPMVIGSAGVALLLGGLVGLADAAP